MGTLQVIGCTGIFALCALPVGQGLSTQVIEVVAGAPHNQVSIRTIDEVRAAMPPGTMYGQLVEGIMVFGGGNIKDDG